MSYANPLMLFGLAGVLIPIIIHLITQHHARRVDWGAMVFLQESVVHRSRKMLLEQILLLVARCLLVGLVAMALALPFVRPDSRVSWSLLIPLVLLGTAALGAAAALARQPRWRWGMVAAGVALFALALWFGGRDQWSHSAARRGGSQDVAIIIDGSDSMNLAVDGMTNFQRAVLEASKLIENLPPGDAATVVLAGSRVTANPVTPSRRMEDLKGVLANLTQPGGMMSATDALSAAAAACGRGDNLSKKIVVITDGQSAGWGTEAGIAWEQLAEPLKKLTVPPTVVLRRLPLPKRIDNVQIAELAVAQGVIGPDKEQPVEVRVENTGTESTGDAFNVELTVNNQPQPLRQPVAELPPGTTRSLTFYVQPPRGGLHSLTANVVRPDDMPWDNSAARVMRAFEGVPVLLVEGNATSRTRDRATWSIDVALAPDADSIHHAPREGYSAGLYRVTTVELPKIDTVADLRAYRVIVLCDVPKVPTQMVVKLSEFVAGGGGLLISLGSRCQKEFYNSWQARGTPLLPATLVERRVADSSMPSTHPLVGSFQHEALRIVGSADSDLGKGTITAYWKLKPAPGDPSARVCATLSSGDPWLVERKVGQGRVMVSSVSLDRAASDLPALEYFAPLIHELVNYLTQLPAESTEVAATGRPAVELRLLGAASHTQADATGIAPAAAQGAQGLQGAYFSGSDFRRLLLTRVDPTIAIQWPATPIAGLTDPAFSVRWSGTLTPPATDAYTFALEGEKTKLWINGKLVAVSGSKTPATPIELVGGRPCAIRVEHVGQAGQGKCELYWQGKQTPRQIVPTTVLSPKVAWQVELAERSKKETVTTLAAELIGPAGGRQAISVAPRDDGATVLLGDKLQPGLYQVRLPETMSDTYSELAVGDTLPVAVRRDARESKLTTLSDSDLASAGPHMSLIAAVTLDDVVAQLSQRGAGQRLWRFLAIAALLLAVAEIALTRWIAVQRMVGHEPVVNFANELTVSGKKFGHAAERFAAK